MIIDTHTHLYLDEFLPEPSEAVKRAVEAGVGRMIFPNIDASTIAPMKDLCAKFPENIKLAIGLHPSEVNDDFDTQLQVMKRELDSAYPYVAVGEIGVDLYWDKTFRDSQMVAFERQCRWAAERELPVIIHCREALNEVLEVLESLPEKPRGVMHSFGGNADDVRRIRSIVPDFYFGINGIVTFKNSRLREVLPEIGLEKLLLETDAPYLAPVPMRGRRNESAYIIHTAAYIASAMNLPINEVENVTADNAIELFGLN